MALPFAGRELKSDSCPVRAPRLGPPISKPFVKRAKIAAVFFGLDRREIGDAIHDSSIYLA